MNTNAKLNVFHICPRDHKANLFAFGSTALGCPNRDLDYILQDKGASPSLLFSEEECFGELAARIFTIGRNELAYNPRAVSKTKAIAERKGELIVRCYVDQFTTQVSRLTALTHPVIGVRIADDGGVGVAASIAVLHPFVLRMNEFAYTRAMRLMANYPSRFEQRFAGTGLQRYVNVGIPMIAACEQIAHDNDLLIGRDPVCSVSRLEALVDMAVELTAEYIKDETRVTFNKRRLAEVDCTFEAVRPFEGSLREQSRILESLRRRISLDIQHQLLGGLSNG